jgi:hypothetical protein
LTSPKHRFIEFAEVAFYVPQKANYEFSGPFAYFKHHFRDFVQVPSLDVHDEENEFA